MSIDERLQLLMEIKRSKIRLRQIAEHVGCSNAWVTNFFSIEKQVHWNDEHINKMKQFVEQYNSK